MKTEAKARAHCEATHSIGHVWKVKTFLRVVLAKKIALKEDAAKSLFPSPYERWILD